MDCKVLLVLYVIVQGVQGQDIQLGKPFSILHGFKPAFARAGDLSRVFYPVKNENLFTNVNDEVVSTNQTFFGPDIKLTYHPDSYNLIQEFFSMWRFEEETRDAAGYIYTAENTTLTLATLLGISPENMVDKAYVLARYWKTLSTTTMTTGDLAGVTSSAVSPSATADNITKLFAEHGTHYLSGYETGDMIYQVFVYDTDVGDDLQQHYFRNQVLSRDVDVVAFRQFTQQKSVGTNGFCHEAGTIKSASGDTTLASIIPQLNDDIYRVAHSILMFLTSREKYELADQLNTTIPIRLFFKPIINKLIPTNATSKSRWSKVLAVVVFQKFGPDSLPGFPIIYDNHEVNVYDSFNPDLVTLTATNYVTITRMTFNLDNFFVYDPKFVTHLFIFADVLRISEFTKLKLPGTQKIYLVCREFVALSGGDAVPEIIVGSDEDSEPSVKIVAKEFRGILKLTQETSGAHFTYDSESVYKTVDDPSIASQKTVKSDSSMKLTHPDRKTMPELYQTGDEGSLEATLLRNSLVNSVELEVTSAESILTVRTSPEYVSTARKSLIWITDTLTRDTQPSSPLCKDLEVVLGRALLITKTQLTEYAKSRLAVPRLTFSQYKPLYESLLTAVRTYETQFEIVSERINERKNTETITTTLTELNANVKNTGEFLVEQAEVNAQYQDDVSNTNQALHDLENDRISRDQGKAEQLLQEIMTVQDEVKAAGKKLEEALDEYQTEQIVSAVLSVVQVVGSLFTGTVGLATIDKKITGVVRVAEKITNVVKIIEQVNKLYDLGINMRNDIGTINRVLENIPSSEISEDSFPTALEWDDFDNDIISYTISASGLSSQVAGKALDFRRVAQRLSARGRRYVTTAANIANIKYKQIQIEMQRDLANRQNIRLRSLKETLTQNELSEYEAKTTDLFEIGNIIKMKDNQVRSQLVQTLAVMDAALQYHYFQEPTLITRFDTMAIHQAAVNQMRSSISALEGLSSRPVNLPQPIEYNVPAVPVRDLLSDVGYKVAIPLTSLSFRDYVRVRIIRLEVRADGITAAANDTVYIQAISSGNAFQDRDLNRNRRQYTTTPTEFRFVYNIATGETHVPVNPTDEFSSKLIKITPFDDWTFHLPKVTTNQGVQFSTVLMTTLRIKFYVNVIFHPGASDRKKHRLFQRTLQKDDVLGSKGRLLSDMNGRSLVSNWDAIMAVNAERVNEIWQQQYDDRTNEGFVQKIVTDRALSSENRIRKTETRLMLDVGPPKIRFVRNNQNRATLTINILSASIEYWETSKRSGTVENFNETFTTNDNSIITANMNLQQLRGTLTEESKVVLDLSNGVFDVASMPFPSGDLMGIRNDIQSYFTTKLKSSHYELATITYEKVLTPASLVPDRFYLATGGFTSLDNSGSSGFGTLYVFIRTHSSGATATHESPRDFNDPLSIDSQIIPTNYEAALFIHNRVIFEDIIKKEIERSFHFGVHTAILPGQSISPSQQSKYVIGNSDARHSLSMTLEYDRARDQRFTFTIPANSLTVKSKNNGRQIEVNWVNSGMNVEVPYPSHQCGGLFCHDTTEHVTVAFNTNYVKTFASAVDNDLTITFNKVSGSGSGTSSVSSLTSWWHGSDFKEAKKQITSSVDDYMSGLTSFNFQSISAFALTQVVFPNQNVFHFTEVYVPGDMIILEPVRSSTNPAKSMKSTSKKSDKAISQKSKETISQKSTKSIWKGSPDSIIQKSRKSTFKRSAKSYPPQPARSNSSLKSRSNSPGRGEENPSQSG